jgi:hypothetical protein
MIRLVSSEIYKVKHPHLAVCHSKLWKGTKESVKRNAGRYEKEQRKLIKFTF